MHSLNVARIDWSANLFILIVLYIYIIPRIVTDPL